jgi:hypothetical protein
MVARDVLLSLQPDARLALLKMAPFRTHTDWYPGDICPPSHFFIMCSAEWKIKWGRPDALLVGEKKSWL